MPEKSVQVEVNGARHFIRIDAPDDATPEEIQAAVEEHVDKNPKNFERHNPAPVGLSNFARSLQEGGMEPLRGIGQMFTSNPWEAVKGELGRSGQEARNTIQSALTGHPLDAANNALKAIPGFGANVQPIEEKLQKGEYGQALGQAGMTAATGLLPRWGRKGLTGRAAEPLLPEGVGEGFGAGAKDLAFRTWGIGPAVKKGLEKYNEVRANSAKQKALTKALGAEVKSDTPEMLPPAIEKAAAFNKGLERLQSEKPKITKAEIAAEKAHMEKMAIQEQGRALAESLLQKTPAEPPMPQLPVGNRGLGRLNPAGAPAPLGPRPTGIPEGMGGTAPEMPTPPMPQLPAGNAGLSRLNPAAQPGPLGPRPSGLADMTPAQKGAWTKAQNALEKAREKSIMELLTEKSTKQKGKR